jgi:hypothetical protein
VRLCSNIVSCSLGAGKPARTIFCSLTLIGRDNPCCSKTHHPTAAKAPGSVRPCQVEQGHWLAAQGMAIRGASESSTTMTSGRLAVARTPRPAIALGRRHPKRAWRGKSDLQPAGLWYRGWSASCGRKIKNGRSRRSIGIVRTTFRGLPRSATPRADAVNDH